jgi:hypothetical protein
MDQIKLDNIEQGLQNHEGAINSFEKIKSPEELLNYMRENIEYGFVGKNNKKIYALSDSDWGAGDFPKDEYYVQSPEQILISKHGLCLDQAELERFWFLKNSYEFKTFIIMFGKEIGQKSPAHTFLAYKNKDKWKWFENTLGENYGIDEFENLNGLIKKAKAVISNNAVNSGATENDLEKIKIYEYQTPKYGCSADEFLNDIISNDAAIEIEE